MHLSVVIPTLNEAKDIKGCIRGVHAALTGPGPFEIIVADCGSADATAALARSCGATVLSVASDAPSRAHACHAGGRRAIGEVVLFLDADTRLPPAFNREIEAALNRPGCVGGAFRFALAESHPALRLVEWINRVRYWLWREYYGDQAVFVRREALESIGGYPLRRLLESAWLCRELKKIGTLSLCRGRAITSGRRFLDGGVLRTLGKDMRIWLLDQLGRNMDYEGAAYWGWNRRRRAAPASPPSVGAPPEN